MLNIIFHSTIVHDIEYIRLFKECILHQYTTTHDQICMHTAKYRNILSYVVSLEHNDLKISIDVLQYEKNITAFFNFKVTLETIPIYKTVTGSAIRYIAVVVAFCLSSVIFLFMYCLLFIVVVIPIFFLIKKI